MSDNSFVIQIPVTPEYVLAVLRDQHRQVRRFDCCCDQEIDLTFDSTIEDWRNAMDLLPTRRLGRVMNHVWNLRLSDRQWRTVLEPAHRSTLKDFAELISQHAVRPKLQPFQMFGTHCLPAAAFLAIKDCLSEAGVEVSRIAPSTPLADFTRRHLVAFVCGVSSLAPGALPDVTVKMPDDSSDRAFVGCAAGLFFCGLLAWIGGPNGLPFVAFGLILQLLWIVGSWFRKPRELVSVTFGELRTFRDMAKCIAAGTQ